MKKTLFGLATAVLLAVPAASSQAALNAYLLIKGSQTKTFAPDAPSGYMKVRILDLEDTLRAAAAAPSGEIVSPRDAASGLPTGKRQHKPFTIVKTIDKATPLLAKAFEDKEALPEATLIIFNEKPGGMVDFVMMVSLSDCIIKQYDKSTPQLAKRNAAPGRAAGSESDPMPTETLSLNFTKIQWKSIGGKQKADDYKLKVSYDVKKNVKA